ncbi:MAG TPA: aminomethyltransferase family protein, partial [Candidatus Acidoferrales bacterium]|nr:aminomethyltransferase family protein [Candidatus Acidoferrales bacterium]
AIHANRTGLKLRELQRTTSRPPYQPVTMGLLNGPIHRPVRLTALHHKHLALNAALMDMGEWKRPKDYGSVEQEYRTIREGVGIIDIGTLGRFIVEGPDSGRFLDFVYTHTYSNLKVGRARYALLLSEAGKILDDGIIARIGETTYLVTSSTGNAEFVENWLKWWQSTGSFNLTVTNVTSGLAAVNVAGPRARDLLSRLVDIDISNEAAPYMSCSRANVADVPAFMLRIGFVGEVGWELHFPAEYAEYLWGRLMAEGKIYGIKPVGVEAMRRLSLDKRHLWPTLDTDAASDALEAGLGWAVRFEKPDFVGKHYLFKTKKAGLRQQFIGFVMNGEAEAETGDVIMLQGKIVGRVTTAGFSYSLKKHVGLAWVPADLGRPHSTVSIVHEGRTVDAEVASGPFYDPEGWRMKS